MEDARAQLLEAVIADVAAHGIGDRSLRDLARSVGSSHRMLLYHFGSRAGLVAAVVAAVEAAQRELLREVAAEVDGPAELVVALWERVTSEELRPFVRLFFEAVSAMRDGDLTQSWLDDAEEVTAMLGLAFDPVDVRLGVAVTRGLLIDVLATGETGPATASLRRFVELWELGRQPATET